MVSFFCFLPRGHGRTWLPLLPFVLLLFCFFTSTCAAATTDLLGMPTPYRWGVTGVGPWPAEERQEVATLLTGLGANSFRSTIRWSDVQPEAAIWNWEALDKCFAKYRASGAHAWVLLNSGDARWATDTSTLNEMSEDSTDCPPLILPGLEEPIVGNEPYYAFVAEAVKRYGDVVDGWLIDNEPSEAWSWSGDSYQYACMARLAAQAIHDTDPTAKVVLGAIPASTITTMVIADRLNDPSQENFITSFASRTWGRNVTMGQIRAIFANPNLGVWRRVEFFRQVLSVLPLMDAVAGNVLAAQARAGTAADIVWAYQDQMQTYGGEDKPLVFTEINPYLSEPLAAAENTTKLMVGFLASGRVIGQSFLEFVDGTVDLPMSDLGLVTASFQPKASYKAYRTLISMLPATATGGKLDLSAPLTGYWLRDVSGATTYVIWSTAYGKVNLSNLFSGREVTVTDMLGAQTKAQSNSIPVAKTPIYLRLSAPLFTDLPQGNWAFGAVSACAVAGIVYGYPDGSYHPESEVTRDQMAVYLSRAISGGDHNLPSAPPIASFTDVSSDHWAFRHIEYTKTRGIVTGYQDSSYRPSEVVDRAQMAVFIARAILGDNLLPPPPVQPTFADVAPMGETAWCYGFVEYVASQGIITGYPDGLFHPDDNCTRDQMAVFIARAFNLSQ